MPQSLAEKLKIRRFFWGNLEKKMAPVARKNNLQRLMIFLIKHSSIFSRKGRETRKFESTIKKQSAKHKKSPRIAPQRLSFCQNPHNDERKSS
jgi:hypothetical protein